MYVLVAQLARQLDDADPADFSAYLNGRPAALGQTTAGTEGSWHTADTVGIAT